MENFEVYWQRAVDLVMNYGPKVLLALLTLVIGWWLINWFTRLLKKGFERSKMEPTLRPFLANLFSWGLKVLLIAR
jgi:small conductance mechanosensitive channel